MDSKGLVVLPKAGVFQHGYVRLILAGPQGLNRTTLFPFFPQVLSRKKQIIPKLEATAKEEL